jgi:hypothetical protein
LFRAERQLERGRFVARDGRDRVIKRLDGSPCYTPQLITDAVNHGLPQIGLNSALASVFESINTAKRL